jgi:hypothetical protein
LVNRCDDERGDADRAGRLGCGAAVRRRRERAGGRGCRRMLRADAAAAARSGVRHRDA